MYTERFSKITFSS